MNQDRRKTARDVFREFLVKEASRVMTAPELASKTGLTLNEAAELQSRQRGLDQMIDHVVAQVATAHGLRRVDLDIEWPY